MEKSRIILIVTGGLLLFILLFAAWLMGTVYFSDRGVSADLWLYYLLMGVLVLFHPVIAKCLDVLGQKKNLFEREDAKIPLWVFAITYLLFGVMSFPVGHFEAVLEFIMSIADAISFSSIRPRRLFFLVVSFIALIPTFISLLICTFLIERSFFAPRKKASFILMKTAVFIGTSWGSIILLGYIAHTLYRINS